MNDASRCASREPVDEKNLDAKYVWTERPSGEASDYVLHLSSHPAPAAGEGGEAYPKEHAHQKSRLRPNSSRVL
jgi:hypothetical protein